LNNFKINLNLFVGEENMGLKLLRLSVKIILLIVVPLSAVFLLYNINYTSEKDTGSIWSNLTSLPFRINYKVPSSCQCDFAKNFKHMSSYLDSVKKTETPNWTGYNIKLK
jgi:hypothetical protein